MELFEFHITIAPLSVQNFISICDVFDIKRIEIESLDGNGNGIKIEHMTSFTRKLENYYQAFKLITEMDYYLQRLGCTIYRSKIESPYYEHYKEKSLYLETHFTSNLYDLPTSRSVKKDKLIATDREMNKDNYLDFIALHEPLGREIEMCLYDTNIILDKQWFEAYNVGERFGQVINSSINSLQTAV